MEDHEKFISSLRGAPQDVSLPVLQDLLNQGYDETYWDTNPGATDGACLAKNGDTQPLADFLSGLSYAAPIFEKTHVGCHCQVKVTGPGLTDVMVSAFGLV